MATALTPHTCRDCGVTIPDGRGWFVWPGFPAAGSAPLGVVWIEDEPEEDEAEGDFPPAGAIALCNACLLIRCPDFGILTDEDDEEEPSDAEVAAAWDRLLPESAVALQRYADGLVATWSPNTHSGTSTSRSAASRTASQMRSSRPVRRSRSPSRSAAIPV